MPFSLWSFLSSGGFMESTETLPRFLERARSWVEKGLERALPGEDETPSSLHKAMRYAVFGGGKRLRPALALGVCESLGGRAEDALAGAVAFELVHTYSLVHDDLPSMDDDDLRRGRPTCHKVFGEALALLAGDALLTLAFLVPAEWPPGGRRALETVRILARAAGSLGMAGGQVLDLEGEGLEPDLESVRAIHLRKTAAMIAGALQAGGVAAGAAEDQVELLGRAGISLGLAFQIQDDVLDETADSATLGKTPGKDRKSGKRTWPAAVGLEASRERARELVREGLALLGEAGIRKGPLPEIARFLADRKK